MTHTPSKTASLRAALTLGLLALSLLLAPAANGAAPDFVLQMPEGTTAPGSGAGELNAPRGIVGNPSTGHVYVSESQNARISEYTAWGAFVKAWGWGVANGAAKLQSCGPATPESAPDPSLCEAGIEGGGKGQLAHPSGIAIDAAGNLYVYDGKDLRVQKFDPKGAFLTAFGGDVVLSGPDDSTNDEVQEITVAAGGGTFTLSLKDPLGANLTATTSALPHDATAAEVQAALNGLSTIAGHGGSVAVTGGPGDSTGSAPYLVTFEGDLGGDDVPQLHIDRAKLAPASTGARLICSTTTEAETIEYRWLRNGAPIPGATASTYATTPADEGAAIQCQVFALSASGGSTQAANPVYVAPPEPAIAPPVAPSELESPNRESVLRPGVGDQTLTCETTESGWKGATSFSYRWYRNGVQILGATESTYVATNADLATPAAFQCAVTASNAGGTATTIVSRNRSTEPPPKAEFGATGRSATASMEPILTLNDGGSAEICKAADACKAGVGGGANGYLSNGSIGNYLAYNPKTDTVFLGDVDRIEEFDTDGAFKAQIPFEGELEAFDGESVRALAADADGNLYLALENTEDVFELSPTGEPLAPGKPGESSFKVGNPLALAVDVEGNVYAVDDPPGESPALEARVIEFDAAANKLVPSKAEEEEAAKEGELFPYVPFHGPVLTGLATNICAGSEAPGNLYIAFSSSVFGEPASYVNAYGSGPVGCEAPPPNPPTINAQYATAVSRDDATLKAQINPRFWQDATYFVQYGTGKCSEGGCDKEQPLPPGAKLTSKAVNGPVSTAPVFLEGLQPGTTYHYRFVAQSSGGGPVYGVGGKPGEDGAEATFRTFAAAGPSQSCPANESFRTGPAARLPDCRAYEMVSPLDKENADAALWRGRSGLVARLIELDQSATSGERFAYTSASAFAEPQGAPFVSQYLAERNGGGWASEAISPPRTASPLPATALLNSEFQGFSEDLCSAWVRHSSVAPLAGGAIEGFANVYRRENCSETPSYEALTTAEPPKRAPEEFYELRALGSSADGTHSIFTANDKLIEGAPTLEPFERLLYEHTPEGLRFVCYLSSGKPSPQACSAGTAGGSGGGNKASVHNAISADGSRIFWSAYSGTMILDSIPGQIYARIDGEETIKVSGSKAADPAWYWTAAEDGSKAIFAFDSGPLKDQLYEFDVETQTASLIAKGVEGPLGASEDASRIYFASTEDLAPGASKGAHNLYLYEADEGGEGSFTFVMALAGQDVGGTDLQPGPIDEVPAERSARVSPDGLHAAFVSVASPTPSGYDNLDAASGQPDQEVYLYDAAQEELLCVSCNPTAARPVGEDIGSVGNPFWIAARIQGWEAQLHAPHVLSDDGHRVYFESHEALVPGDTNGAWDVYQWEEAGSGSCEEGDASFSAASEGCVDLISSGQSPRESTFLDADPSGKNVFIGTLSSLVAQDYGLNDVYDARIDGGFANPQPSAACEGEACQGPLSPPNDPTPASSSFEGAGNVREAPKARCRKGKVRRRGRCIVKHHKRANHKRRAAR